MKTQIIRLDPEDDHHSAREKLRWAKAPRVVLVWPGRGRALVRRLDLVLLQRQAQALGIQLGLISFDPQVEAIAKELGIPIFETIERIDKATWSVARGRRLSSNEVRERPNVTTLPRPKRDPSPLPVWARYLGFAAPLLLVIVAIAASLPAATVVLDPQITVERQTYEIDIEADSAHNRGLELESMRVDVDGRLRVPTTGETSAPDGTAVGELQMTNLSAAQLRLPSGTRLRALIGGGLAFETTALIVLPAGEERAVPVRSVEPGPQANLEPGTAWAMEGEPGLIVAVQNETPFTGGSLAMRRAVSRSDLQEARELLQSQLLQSARTMIEQSLAPDQMLIPGSLQILQTLSSSQDLEIGDTGDSVEVQLSLAFEGKLLYTAQLQQVLEGILRSDLEPGKAYQPASLSVDDLSLRRNAQDHLILTAGIEANTLMDVDRSALALRLRGVPRNEIDPIVREHAAGSSVLTLDLKPGWLPILPLFEFQIAVAFPWEASS